MLKSIYTQERRTKVAGVVSGVYRPSSNGNGTQHKCRHCGEPLHFDHCCDTEEILSVACGFPKFCNRDLDWNNKFPRLVEIAAPKDESVGNKGIGKVEENCPECGGPPGARRGWRHTPDCSKSQIKQVRENCPECGGPPGRRHGWRHTPDCSKAPGNRPCTECGGPHLEEGGFDHKEDCSRGGKSANCPECGGVRRGRGWKHKDGCSLSTKYVPKTKRGVE